MSNLRCVSAIVGLFVVAVPAHAGDWVNFADETAFRVVADPDLFTLDDDAKNYAWADVDKDGDIDLVIVRKQPYNTTGRRSNVLLLNEGTVEGHALDGVLVDCTAEYVSSANDGGQGFLDLTNDRDVALVDLDGDTWLDMVTSTALSQGQVKTISHPRVYMNLGMLEGAWQGFHYDEGRTPTMPIVPNFCGIGYGDVTGDDRPDLYFSEYENNLEDRLWINDGNGFFTDESEARMSFEMRESEFGVHALMVDLNHDGFMDIVKDRANGAPYRITVAYNDPDNIGFFSVFETVYGSGSPYYVEAADLNNDGLVDLVLQDDAIDRYLINQGNGSDGLADFVAQPFPPQSNHFEGVIEVADLDNDGFVDVLVSDETVNGTDCCCNRELHIWRNDGNLPAIAFNEETSGIPIGARIGTFDVAPFDINGDGWRDLVIGNCAGTSIWISQVGLAFSYPQPLPDSVFANFPTDVEVAIDGVGPGAVDPDSVVLHVATGAGPFVEVPMAQSGGATWSAQLPAAPCLETQRFYFSASEAGGMAIFTDPPSAPEEVYSTTAVVDDWSTVDDLEGSVSGWTVVNDAALTSGAWEQAAPVGTIFSGSSAAPDAAASGAKAFVTQNCPPAPASCGGHPAADADVDGGSTTLISPVIDLDFDLDGGDAVIHASVWSFSSGDEVLTIDVSANGGQDWVPALSIADTAGVWQPVAFRVGNFVTPSGDVRVRFVADDTGRGSIVEAGVDLFEIEYLLCFLCEGFACCDGDMDGIRDDGCLWCACNGPCLPPLEVPIVFGDMGGQFGVCMPDGTADGNDRFHALNCFANVDADMDPGYPCEPLPPQALNVDAGGAFGNCTPDGVCDGNDAFHALNAFADISPCSCPLDGAPAPTAPASKPASQSAVIELRPTKRSVTPGEQFEVDVFLASPLKDLRGYQLHVEASAGRRGTLELVDIYRRLIPGTKLFMGEWFASNIATHQLVVGVDGVGPGASAGTYLATFVYQASRDAAGRFTIELQFDVDDPAQRTFLFPTAPTGVIMVEAERAVVDVVRGR